MSAGRTIFWSVFWLCACLAIGGALTIIIGFKNTLYVGAALLAVVALFIRVLWISAQGWSTK